MNNEIEVTTPLPKHNSFSPNQPILESPPRPQQQQIPQQHGMRVIQELI